MFRTVFPSIIRSQSLYTQHQVYVMLSTNLYDIYLMCVQSWTPDDGRKDRPKHVEWYSLNSKNCTSISFYYRNVARRFGVFAATILWDELSTAMHLRVFWMTKGIYWLSNCLQPSLWTLYYVQPIFIYYCYFPYLPVPVAAQSKA
jgi:hypothetical protein